MTAYGVKSSNGRITWILDKGRLTEISPESFKFTLTATDTEILFGLLAAGSQDIIDAARKEMEQFGIQKQTVIRETASVEVGRLPSKKKDKTEEDEEEDYVEGVEVE